MTQSASSVKDLLDRSTAFILKQHEALCSVLDNISKAAAAGEPMPVNWPKDKMPVSSDVILSVFTQIKQLQAQQQGISAEQLMNIEAYNEALILVPNLMSVLYPWSKVRTIVRITEPADMAETESFESARLADLPQWAVFFDISGQNFVWDNTEIAALGFARSFFGSGDEGGEALPGEPPALFNNIVCILLSADGNFMLGPSIPLKTGKSISEMLKNSIDEVLAGLDDNELHGEENSDEMKKSLTASAEDTAKRTALLTSYLVKFLKEQHKLKDADGNGVLLNMPKAGTQATESSVYYL